MNLDDFEPMWGSKRIMVYQSNTIGVNTTSLNDWRKIENLYNKVSELAEKASRSYWNLLKNCLNDSKCKEVWWIDTDDQFAYIYNGQSVGSRHLPQFVEELIPDVNRRGYKLSPDERKKIISLDSIVNTQRTRAHFLYECFSKAVQSRLSQWFNQKKFHEHYSKNVVFKNNDRAYSTKVMKYHIESIVRLDEMFD